MSENADNAAGTDPQDEGLGDGGKKALQAERDARKAAERSVTELQFQLDALQSSQMSDLEKAQAQAKKFEDEAIAARAEASRLKVAVKHGLSDADAEFLATAHDEQAMERLAARLAQQAVVDASPTVPKPDLTQGGSGSNPKPSTADAFAAAIKEYL